MNNAALTTTNQPITPALRSAVIMWASASTNASSARRADLIRDKTAALLGTSGKAVGFFVYAALPPEKVTPADVQNWREYMESVGLAPASIYGRISRLSAFYVWLMEQPAFQQHINLNPVLLARPKAPQPYQNDSAQALSDEDAAALLETVRKAAKTGDLTALRDYALLRFYFATGKRRAEIIGLKWGDLKVNGVIVINTREKGSLYRATEITNQGVKAALYAYLKASGRWNEQTNTPELTASDPLWLRHDRAAKGRQPITSHGFVKALKAYASAAGIGEIHLHQTRHTVARIVGEDSGDMGDVQTVLGHADRRTTAVYLARIAVKKDKYSAAIASRLNLDEDET